MPVVIMGGMMLGVFTPTEAAVVAALYAFLLGALRLPRTASGVDLAVILLVTGKQTAQVMFIIASAGDFRLGAGSAADPQSDDRELLTVSDRPWVILLMVNVILLILGMFIEGIAIMIMVVPIFVPSCRRSASIRCISASC